MQQVDLVDVEHPAVRRREQPWLVGAHSRRQRPLEVERADQAILGGADGQLDKPRRPALGKPVRGAIGAVGVAGRTGEPAARDDLDRRQQRRERPHHGRLGRALLPADEHPADGG